MSSNDAISVSSGKMPWTQVWTALLLGGLAGWAVLAATGDADRAWRALLIGFVYFTPLAGGMVAWPAIVLASQGRWMGPTRGVALSGVGFAPVSLLALAALWIGKSHWAGWLKYDHLHNAAWLNPAWLFPRDLAALLVFWLLAGWFACRMRRGEQSKVLAAWLIFAYAVVFSLLGIDLVMALDPHWTSALFPGYFFISGLYVAVAAWTLTALLTGRGEDRSRRHDLGKLIVAFSLLTTYMMFSQLIVLWYENLPDEVRFVIPRLSHSDWPRVTAGLLATIYLGPLVLLLTQRAKKSPAFLGAIALLVLAGMWFERWWLVTPTLGGPLVVGWPEASIAAAFLGALALSVQWLTPPASAEFVQLQEAEEL